jgi:hypothetical protein
MTSELCRFSLAYPQWLAWLLAAIGFLILAPGLWRLATSASPGTIDIGNKTLRLGNFYPLLLFLLGALPLIIGICLLGAVYHEPFARGAGGVISTLIYEQDPKMSVDLTDTSLDDLVSRLKRPALYVVRTSSTAKKTTISGTYRDATCGADLINQICRNETTRLACDIDRDAKVIRVCTKADETACKSRSF